MQIVSSFDLIRKERQQQLKVAAQAEKAAKAQKQQQQQQLQSNGKCNNGGRVRAKSQGDKMCVQQANSNKNNNTNNNGGNNKQRVQKQLSMIIVNSNATANNDNKSNRNNNATHNTAIHNTRVATSPTLSASSSGTELLAFAATSSAAPCMSAATNLAQKPRPASVSLHFATSPTPVAGQATQQLQHMTSGTTVRILNHNTSYQPQTEQQELQTKTEQSEPENIELPRQQQAQLKFTPCLNSWINFSFTKNFIANIFC